jgi:hypothetical protein
MEKFNPGNKPKLKPTLPKTQIEEALTIDLGVILF